MIKYKSRVIPSLDKFDISFHMTKIIDCKTEEYAEMIVDKLSRLKNAKFDNILIPEFDYSLEGVILTQEVEKLGLPGLTTTREENGIKAVRYERLIPLLIEAIKELKGEVDELKRTK